ncbi:MAG TPA: hypothetical protein PKZ76_13565 [Xanthomonadaceae bacterium]|nr:hypothetical protein [Xanthomonadaceae bacterium]
MLHAIERKKSPAHRRYTGHRDEHERRVHEEDEITSLVFGTLSLLPDEEGVAFWLALLDRLKVSEGLRCPESGLAQQISLWPRLAGTDDDGRAGVEPDMMVTLSWDAKEGPQSLVLLVEFKWRAPLSGDDQLQRQWRAAKMKWLGPGNRLLHLFVGQDLSGAHAARARNDVWSKDPGNSLHILPWTTVRTLLGEIAASNAKRPMARWASVVERFLGSVGITRFGGFAAVVDKAGPILDVELAGQVDMKSRIFWNEHKGQTP